MSCCNHNCDQGRSCNCKTEDELLVSCSSVFQFIYYLFIFLCFLGLCFIAGLYKGGLFDRLTTIFG